MNTRLAGGLAAALVSLAALGANAFADQESFQYLYGRAVPTSVLFDFFDEGRVVKIPLAKVRKDLYVANVTPEGGGKWTFIFGAKPSIHPDNLGLSVEDWNSPTVAYEYVIYRGVPPTRYDTPLTFSSWILTKFGDEATRRDFQITLKTFAERAGKFADVDTYAAGTSDVTAREWFTAMNAQAGNFTFITLGDPQAKVYALEMIGNRELEQQVGHRRPQTVVPDPDLRALRPLVLSQLPPTLLSANEQRVMSPASMARNEAAVKRDLQRRAAAEAAVQRRKEEAESAVYAARARAAAAAEVAAQRRWIASLPGDVRDVVLKEGGVRPCHIEKYTVRNLVKAETWKFCTATHTIFYKFVNDRLVSTYEP